MAKVFTVHGIGNQGDDATEVLRMAARIPTSDWHAANWQRAIQPLVDDVYTEGASVQLPSDKLEDMFVGTLGDAIFYGRDRSNAIIRNSVFAELQALVRSMRDGENLLLYAHSLGTVIIADLLHEITSGQRTLARPVTVWLLVTAGSPLKMYIRGRFERPSDFSLQPWPVEGWYNFRDPHDPIGKRSFAGWVSGVKDVEVRNRLWFGSLRFIESWFYSHTGYPYQAQLANLLRDSYNRARVKENTP